VKMTDEFRLPEGAFRDHALKRSIQNANADG
jgi:hypothetical protein